MILRVTLQASLGNTVTWIQKDTALVLSGLFWSLVKKSLSDFVLVVSQVSLRYLVRRTWNGCAFPTI